MRASERPVLRAPVLPPNAQKRIRFRPARPGIPACHLRLPPAASPNDPLPLVISVHGISLDAEEQMRLFGPVADRFGFALLAPVFEASGWQDYQRLGRRGRGPRADLALQALIEDCVAQGDLQIADEFLIGYSGGAQFVHRYVLAHPLRATAAVVAAAGWYTPPDPRRAYPHGLRIDGSLAGIQISPADLHRCPVLVCVGERDVERERSLRQTAQLDRVQGRNRRTRARRWVRAMRRSARLLGVKPRISLFEIPAAGHSFAECVEAGLGERAFRFFEDSRRKSK